VSTERRSVGEDILWTPGVADLVECVNQSILVVRLECKVEVDGGASRRVAESLPVRRDDIPGVLDT